MVECCRAKISGARNSITVLIDQEGNIYQTNLRGPQLEEAVKQLLGE